MSVVIKNNASERGRLPDICWNWKIAKYDDSKDIM